MKLTISIILITTVALGVSAQVEDIKLDDRTTIKRLYLGLRSDVFFPIDSFYTYNQVNLRAGAYLEHQLSEAISLKSFGVFQATQTANKGFGSYWISLKFKRKLELNTGLLATPTTTLRPNPTTWQSQVESHAQSTIPGGKPGLRMTYFLSKDVSLSSGIFRHENVWAYHLKMRVKNWKIATFYDNTKGFFIATSFDTPRFNSTITYLESDEFSNATFINLNGFSFYNDISYHFKRREINYQQYGLRKYYQYKKYHISGFMSLAYDLKNKQIKGQLFIHI